MKTIYNCTVKVFLLVTLFIITSCAKDKQGQLAGSTWEVTSITSPDGSNSLLVPVTVNINFGKDRNVNLHLDVNSCTSTYTTVSAGKISIQPFGCTKMCCDDANAETLRSLLSEVTDFKVTESVAQLNAPGKVINLVKKTN